MGINVIPSLPGAVAVALAPPGSAASTASAEAAPGDFASLLFGELRSLVLAADAAGTRTSLADAGPGRELQDDAEAPLESMIDPALIAALNGNPAVQPNPAAGRDLKAAFNGKAAETVEGTPGKGTPQAAVLVNAQPDAGAAVAAGKDKAIVDTKGSSSAVPATFEKLLAGTANGSPATAVRAEAANIAADFVPGQQLPAVANGLGMTAAGRQAPESTAASHQTAVAAHVQSPAWAQHFGEKIVWLARNEQQSAQININPPQLGPIQITLNLSGDQASLAFASPHAEVRQAIESAMPQLKDMLSAAGINLGQSSVGANLNQSSPENPFQAANGNRLAGENAILPANDKEAMVGPGQALQRGRGLVDLFA